MTRDKAVLVLAGPTASGKSAVAAELAKRIPSEIISCDSMQIYRGMSVVTQATVPSNDGAPAPSRRPVTHLVSFLPPSRRYSAADFRRDAEKLIEGIFKKKKTPLIVGGTGLYLRALLDGLFETENASRDEAYRKKLLKEAERKGAAALHERLASVDPAAAAKIHANDTRRVVRALEVFHLTGKPISAQKADRRGIRGFYDMRIFLIDRDREDLYARINRRVDAMLEEGLVEEVKKLTKKRLSQTASMALGIREIKAYLEGATTLQAAVELLKQNTRNYAKRQLSWFRHEKGIEVVPVASGETPAQTAEAILARWKGEAV